MPDSAKLALRYLLIALEQVEKMRQQVYNQKHAYDQLPEALRQKIITDIFDVNLKHFDAQSKQIQGAVLYQ